jgi:hypothetical protein
MLSSARISSRLCLAQHECAHRGEEEQRDGGAGEHTADTEPIEGRTPASRQRLPKAIDVYWQPWSE